MLYQAWGKIVYCIGEKWYLRLAKNTAKKAQTCHSEALLFPPLWFSWPIRSTLGVDSLRFFVQCCAFDLCCAQLYSPLIIMCLSYLKKARRHVSEVSCILWSFYPGFYCWCFRKRRTKRKHYPWRYFIIGKFYKLLLSLCHCVPAQSNHNLSHSWRFYISVVVVCWHCWWSGRQEVQSKLVSLFFCSYLSKTPKMHLAINLMSNLFYCGSFFSP